MITPPPALSAAASATDRPLSKDQDRPRRRGRGPRAAQALPAESGLIPESSPPPAADLRLVVETRADGSPAYLWLDRLTGAVSHRLVREDLELIERDPDYVAGAWVDTLA